MNFTAYVTCIIEISFNLYYITENLFTLCNFFNFLSLNDSILSFNFLLIFQEIFQFLMSNDKRIEDMLNKDKPNAV